MALPDGKPCTGAGTGSPALGSAGEAGVFLSHNVACSVPLADGSSSRPVLLRNGETFWDQKQKAVASRQGGGGVPPLPPTARITAAASPFGLDAQRRRELEDRGGVVTRVPSVATQASGWGIRNALSLWEPTIANPPTRPARRRLIVSAAISQTTRLSQQRERASSALDVTRLSIPASQIPFTA